MQSTIDIECWVNENPEAQIPETEAYKVRLWDGNAFDEKRTIADQKPTARQILETFERFPADEHVLLYLPRGGKLEPIELDETIDLRARGPERFFAFKTDRLLNFVANGRRFAWGANKIPVALVRQVARIPDNEALYLERTDAADKELKDGDVVHLGGKELERLSSREQSWKLNVQGVLLTLTTPLIAVKDALAQAGFDPNDNWIAILKRKGEAKLQVALTDQIDLRLPGIEKLRLTPGQINNGDAHSAPRRTFQLLEKDETYLQQRGLSWETFQEGGRRWLLLRKFVLPEGYNHAVVDIAIDVPVAYPRAEIDMFHCLPHLTLKAGGVIGETTGRTPIQGQTYQQWSRHLNGKTRWDPTTDSVMTHIAVIEAALLKEVGQ
ncbi:multiubiquitin domain-containing protein [Sulfitobacter geojensis]|uniref:Multiubiquitin domain-containing protein n=1 Tax=Sulfitobacter geojensis TaxID=1342299 RepID=A0AAE2VXM6_9RHOB|nr:multiubiquitin domain-containing protein [Sulfitobacter geojensis]MBM1689279.1 multiubiquitin domain-containing protein [Sulfitobacter geojensis]MBM1693345.1 multiubiquitin domain-containing protein [Sulfitobacter geojensis]MBM1705511.1 multiubiquitin domain-containing protein [Sulfitobacter geojensis]MBM1709569.1 multiubiquitin domain-containing protein [Sulfitobacter geojensis]MBM1713635.1 multiubiquitin domain-containing protein [Sulfitobacter geojensis]